MKTQNIFVLSFKPKFNPDFVDKFSTFDETSTLILNKALILNHKQLLNIDNGEGPLFILDKSDENFVPDELKEGSFNLSFMDTEDPHLLLKKLNDKYFTNSSSNLIILSESIGYTLKDLTEVFNHLSIEDEAIVLGKSVSNKIAFIGFNNYNGELFNSFDWLNLNYEHTLAASCKHENFIHIIANTIMTIHDADDFKRLYAELSKKESLAYCSQNIHEEFTNLFIDYKELLK